MRKYKTIFYARFLLFSIFTAMLVLMASCQKTDSYVSTPNEVTITSTEVIPNSIDIFQDREVIWTNNDTVPHFIKSGSRDDPGGFFEIGPINPGETMSLKFDSLGSFTYYCPKNPDHIIGIVNVEEDTLVEKSYLSGNP